MRTLSAPLTAFAKASALKKRCPTAVMALVLAALIVATIAPLFAQGGRTFKARLAPVPIDLTMQATVAGLGSAKAVLAGTKLTVNGTFDGLRSPATIAQVHKSPTRGMRGPVVFDLAVSRATSGTVTGQMDLTPAQVTDLEKGRLYVQIHSEKAPDGNLWGWLLPSETRK